MKYTALIVAAGKGQRMGLGYNKVFFQLSEDITVLEKTISIFAEDKNCQEIVVVVSASEYQRCLMKNQSGNVVFVSGGERRVDSVYNGLMAVSQDKVLIHDGARPYLSSECLKRVVEASAKNPAVIPGVKVKDTMKYVVDGQVKETLDRSLIYHIQTPQAFDTDLVIECYKKAFTDDFEGTDDAEIVEQYGKVAIKVVEGDYKNIKITTIEDLPK